MAQSNVRLLITIEPSGRTRHRLISLLPEKQTNVERFYEWLQKCGNIHLADDEKVSNAFNKIPL